MPLAIARSCIRGGARARFYNVVDLVNGLEGEARAARQGRIADHLARLDLVRRKDVGATGSAGSQTTDIVGLELI